MIAEAWKVVAIKIFVATGLFSFSITNSRSASHTKLDDKMFGVGFHSVYMTLLVTFSYQGKINLT